MNREKTNDFLEYLEKQMDACKLRETEMLGDDRTDERIFEKIQGNVYEIFKTVFLVAMKNAEDDVAVKTFFLQKLEQLPMGWQASLDKAMAHGDAQKAQIERIKLEAAEEISKGFKELYSNV